MMIRDHLEVEARSALTLSLSLSLSLCLNLDLNFAILLSSLFEGNIAGGWEAVKEELAQKYHDGGYPEIAVLIKS
jgi:hypothetical protein